MRNHHSNGYILALFVAVLVALPFVAAGISRTDGNEIGREVAISRHLQDGEEYEIPTHQLIEFGAAPFLGRVRATLRHPRAPFQTSR